MCGANAWCGSTAAVQQPPARKQNTYIALQGERCDADFASLVPRVKLKRRNFEKGAVPAPRTPTEYPEVILTRMHGQNPYGSFHSAQVPALARSNQTGDIY